MIKSMTGFGRCEKVTEEYKLSVEMKAVNHRYLDMSIKMPKKFNYFEAGIRNLLKNDIQRGKVDVFINYEDYTENKMSLKYNLWRLSTWNISKRWKSSLVLPMILRYPFFPECQRC